MNNLVGPEQSEWGTPQSNAKAIASRDNVRIFHTAMHHAAHPHLTADWPTE